MVSSKGYKKKKGGVSDEDSCLTAPWQPIRCVSESSHSTSNEWHHLFPLSLQNKHLKDGAADCILQRWPDISHPQVLILPLPQEVEPKFLPLASEINLLCLTCLSSLELPKQCTTDWVMHWGFTQSSCDWGLNIRRVSLLVLEAGIWDPGVGRAGSSWGLSPGRVDGRLFPVSSRGRPCVCVCVLISTSYKDTSPVGSGPTLMTSFYPHPLFKDPISKYSPILRSWGSGLQHMDFEGTHFSPCHHRMGVEGTLQRRG